MGKVNTKITQEATSGAQHGSLSTRPAIKRHLARSGYLREDVFLSDAQLLGGTQRGPLVVTGHHVHSNALAMQAGNSHLGLGPDEVAERQHPGQLLVDGAINTDGAFSCAHTISCVAVSDREIWCCCIQRSLPISTRKPFTTPRTPSPGSTKKSLQSGTLRRRPCMQIYNHKHNRAPEAGGLC